MRAIVDNRVRMRTEGADEDLLSALRMEFTHTNPEYGRIRALQKKGVRIPLGGMKAAIATWREEGGEISFPRGGLARIRVIVEERGGRLSLVDRRSLGAGPRGEIPDLGGKELRPYQERLILAALAAQDCLLRSATGSGKSLMIVALAARLKLPTLVIVPTGGLGEQWLEVVREELGLDDVGWIGDGEVRLRPLTIGVQKGVWVALKKDPKIAEYFGFVAYDEVQFAPADTCVECVDPFTARYRVGVSADERRKDGKHFLARDLFGPVAAEATKAECLSVGAIVPVEVRVFPTDFRADWYGFDVGAGKTTRAAMDFVRLCKEMSEDNRREWMIRKVVRDELKAGSRAIVLAHEREHCERLAAGIRHEAGVDVGLILGTKKSRPEYLRAVAGLKDGTVPVACGTYKSLGTGVNIPAVEVGVAATPIAANRGIFGQVEGRLCRQGKESARLYVPWDRHVYDWEHLANIARWNKFATILRSGEWIPIREGIKLVKEGGF